MKTIPEHSEVASPPVHRSEESHDSNILIMASWLAFIGAIWAAAGVIALYDDIGFGGGITLLIGIALESSTTVAIAWALRSARHLGAIARRAREQNHREVLDAVSQIPRQLSDDLGRLVALMEALNDRDGSAHQALTYVKLRLDDQQHMMELIRELVARVPLASVEMEPDPELPPGMAAQIWEMGRRSAARDTGIRIADHLR